MLLLCKHKKPINLLSVRFRWLGAIIELKTMNGILLYFLVFALLIIYGYTIDRMANNSLFACATVVVVVVVVGVAVIIAIVFVVMTRHLLFSVSFYSQSNSENVSSEILSRFNAQTKELDIPKPILSIKGSIC